MHSCWIYSYYYLFYWIIHHWIGSCGVVVTTWTMLTTQASIHPVPFKVFVLLLRTDNMLGLSPRRTCFFETLLYQGMDSLNLQLMQVWKKNWTIMSLDNAFYYRITILMVYSPLDQADITWTLTQNLPTMHVQKKFRETLCCCVGDSAQLLHMCFQSETICISALCHTQNATKELISHCINIEKDPSYRSAISPPSSSLSWVHSSQYLSCHQIVSSHIA